MGAVEGLTVPAGPAWDLRGSAGSSGLRSRSAAWGRSCRVWPASAHRGPELRCTAPRRPAGRAFRCVVQAVVDSSGLASTVLFFKLKIRPREGPGRAQTPRQMVCVPLSIADPLGRGWLSSCSGTSMGIHRLDLTALRANVSLTSSVEFSALQTRGK